MDDKPMSTNQADPQQAIDAALGVSTETPTAPTEPTPAPAPEPAPVTPPVEPPQPPLEMTTAPTLATATPPASQTVGEMPLAFTGGTSSEKPTPSPQMETFVPPTPVATPEPAPVIPPLPSVAPPISNDEAVKKANEIVGKPKRSKKIVAALMMFFFAGIAAMGYYYFTYYSAQQEQARIAAITDPKQCTGCSKPVDGGWLVWRNGECKVTGVCNSSKDTQNTENPQDPIAEAKDQSSCQSASGTWCQSIDSNGTPYAFCIPSDQMKGCNQWAVEKGYSITYGSSWSTTNDDKFKYACVCNAKTYYFDKPGICNSTSVTYLNGQPTSEFIVTRSENPEYYNTWGLCAVATKPAPSGQKATYLSDYNNCFTCSNDGCSIRSAEKVGGLETGASCGSVCTVIKYTCKGQTSSSCLDDPTEPSGALSFSSKCGTVEQMDVMCNGAYIQSRSKINGECQTTTTTPTPSPIPSPIPSPKPSPVPSPTPSPIPSPTPKPTLSCTGISKDKASSEITLGTSVTFTCSGASTPAGAVNLSYQFRIRKDGGFWETLSPTGSRASYTVNAYGDYDVQCRACGQIDNASVCDPEWLGGAL